MDNQTSTPRFTTADMVRDESGNWVSRSSQQGIVPPNTSPTQPGIYESADSTVLKLPGGGTVNVPNTAKPIVTTTVPSNPADLKGYINTWQSNLMGAVGNTPMDKLPADFGLGAISLEDITKNNPMPQAPNLEQTYGQLREQSGVVSLEGSLNELKALQREQEAIKRQRLNSTRGEVSRMDAIEGRVSQVERQENERIDSLNREIAYKVDQINSANSAISTIMQFKQTDFQNAKSMWETTIQTSLEMYKQFRSDYEFDKTFEQKQKEREQDMAMANLTLYTKLISEGNLNFANMPASQKAEIGKLEVQAGLPVGFLSSIQMTPGANIKYMEARVDQTTGVKYLDMITIMPDGSKKLTTTKLGKADLSLAEQKSYKSVGTGSGSTSTSTQKTYNSYVKSATDELLKFESTSNQAIWGEDGKGGDKLLAEWEVQQFINTMVQRYGADTGKKVAADALSASGIQIWKPK